MSALFSFRGRCGRLAYLGISVVQMAVLALAFMVGGFGLVAGEKGAAGGTAIGVVFILIGLVAMVWIGAAALARRVRDIGWDPMMAVPLWYGSTVIVILAPTLAIPITLAQGIFGLIFVFKGPAPYDTEARARGHSTDDATGTDADMDRALEAMLAARAAQKASAGTASAAPGRAPMVQRAAPQGGFGRRGLTA